MDPVNHPLALFCFVSLCHSCLFIERPPHRLTPLSISYHSIFSRLILMPLLKTNVITSLFTSSPLMPSILTHLLSWSSSVLSLLVYFFFLFYFHFFTLTQWISQSLSVLSQEPSFLPPPPRCWLHNHTNCSWASPALSCTRSE